MRAFLVGLLALTACKQLSGTSLTAADVKNAYTCLSQLRALSATAQEQVPACLQLADRVKTNGPVSE